MLSSPQNRDRGEARVAKKDRYSTGDSRLMSRREVINIGEREMAGFDKDWVSFKC